jgi:hypothetical protein
VESNFHILPFENLRLLMNLFPFSDLERPSYVKFGDYFAGGIGAGRSGSNDLCLTGRGGPAYGIPDSRSINADKGSEAGCLFVKVGFHIDDKHGDRRVPFIDGGHGKNAGAHFCCHTKTGEVGGSKRVAGKPFEGHCDGAAGIVGCRDANAGEEGTGNRGQQIETEADGAAE